MHSDVVFRTSRFNLSQRRSYFINECCFGDDLATWLSRKMRELGVEIERAPYQEDWGWEFSVRLGSDRYYLGVGGISDDDPADPDRGEYRIMFTKRRSIWDRISGKNKLTGDDAIMRAVENILAREPDFAQVHREPEP